MHDQECLAQLCGALTQRRNSRKDEKGFKGWLMGVVAAREKVVH